MTIHSFHVWDPERGCMIPSHVHAFLEIASTVLNITQNLIQSIRQSRVSRVSNGILMNNHKCIDTGLRVGVPYVISNYLLLIPSEPVLRIDPSPAM